MRIPRAGTSGPTRSVLPLLALLVLLGGCSVKKMALNSMASTFAESGKVYTTDDDPELVRNALPFALKTMETILVDLPEHHGLLLSACQGFTQYAYAFVQSEALYAEEEDWNKAERLRERALRLYLRARDYGIRGLELEYEGIVERLIRNPEEAAAELEEEHIELVFWTAAAWGSAISIGRDEPALVADVGVVFTLMERCLEMDETFLGGGLHEVMIGLEALPEEMGGSIARAREHYERALELTEGESVGTYVTMAESVSISTQNREEFVQLLDLALAIDPYEDPENRLQNILAWKRARFLLDHIDDYFLDDGTLEEEGSS